jgi:hypothetical protein
VPVCLEKILFTVLREVHGRLAEVTMETSSREEPEGFYDSYLD